MNLGELMEPHARTAPGSPARETYPDDGSVRVEGPTEPYIWGDRMISLHHCPTCGCFTDWRSTGESHGRVGVNARLLDGFSIDEGRPQFDGREIEVRYFDNAG